MITLSAHDIAALNRVRERIAPSPAALSFTARREQAKRFARFNRSIAAGLQYSRTHRVYMGKPV